MNIKSGYVASSSFDSVTAFGSSIFELRKFLKIKSTLGRNSQDRFDSLCKAIFDGDQGYLLIWSENSTCFRVNRLGTGTYGNWIISPTTATVNLLHDHKPKDVEVIPYCPRHDDYKHCCGHRFYVVNAFRICDLPFQWERLSSIPLHSLPHDSRP
jgi:hypothetical protein